MNLLVQLHSDIYGRSDLVGTEGKWGGGLGHGRYGRGRSEQQGAPVPTPIICPFGKRRVYRSDSGVPRPDSVGPHATRRAALWAKTSSAWAMMLRTSSAHVGMSWISPWL